MTLRRRAGSQGPPCGRARYRPPVFSQLGFARHFRVELIALAQPPTRSTGTAKVPSGKRLTLPRKISASCLALKRMTQLLAETTATMSACARPLRHKLSTTMGSTRDVRRLNPRGKSLHVETRVGDRLILGVVPTGDAEGAGTHRHRSRQQKKIGDRLQSGGDESIGFHHLD
jgi:hypothetical protein